MQIPQYWAQARLRHHTGVRHGVTVQRWGWSDHSESEAQAHAEQRARQALEMALAPAAARGLPQDFERMEWRTEYGLLDGTPIREEVLERRDESVMTRNSYGARCLNTENVAIADIDLPARQKPARFPVISSLLLALALPWLWVAPLSWNPGAAVLMLLLASIGLFFWSGLKQWLNARQALRNDARQPPPIEIALARIQAFSARHPDWGLRVYETPKGLRVIVTHAAFSPSSSEVQMLFQQLEVDPLYAMLCRQQQCFRARVSGKPWRMGMNGLSTQDRRWPLPAVSQASRQQWVSDYESRSAQFAACRFVDQLGESTQCSAARTFVTWHDECSKAHSTLALA
ncbi:MULTISPECIES: hypothetical protein [Comamonas]|jgi:hypothetical protein|uniref:hypothetical protein n=1 Tax=Comamonas TaxID=283 RepID=UPI0012D09E2A|nr:MULTISPECIES: hypothetical protein [Comamonas]MDR3065816.1 hypothetical protein [Comamonas sp.]MEB5965546.1 hypothetical protein [Comamonas testosteroni]MPS93537.1 hypothetical protein [Comamonas sp.]